MFEQTPEGSEVTICMDVRGRAFQIEEMVSAKAQCWSMLALLVEHQGGYCVKEVWERVVKLLSAL